MYFNFNIISQSVIQNTPTSDLAEFVVDLAHLSIGAYVMLWVFGCTALIALFLNYKIKSWKISQDDPTNIEQLYTKIFFVLISFTSLISAYWFCQYFFVVCKACVKLQDAFV